MEILKINQVIKIFTLFLTMTLFYGCPSGVPNVVLKSNKMKIDNSLKGVWKIDDDLDLEIRKKDDYWGYVRWLSKDKKHDQDGFTLHRINDQIYACIQGWNSSGKKFGEVYAIEIRETNLKVFELTLNKEDKEVIKNTPLRVSEPVFLDYLKKGKIKKGKAYYYYKKYDLED